MSEILNLLPPDILQIETPAQIHQQEAVVPAKPDDDGTSPEAIDAVFSEEKQEKPEEISPAMAYALWSMAGIIGDKARSHLQRAEREDEEKEGQDEDEEFEQLPK
jgi:hypothetical protein